MVSNIAQLKGYSLLLKKVFDQDLTDIKVQEIVFSQNRVLQKQISNFVFRVSRIPETKLVRTEVLIPNIDKQPSIELSGDSRTINMTIDDLRYGKTSIYLRPDLLSVKLKLEQERVYITDLLELIYKLLDIPVIAEITVSFDKLYKTVQQNGQFMDIRLIYQRVNETKVPLPYVLFVSVRSVNQLTTDTANIDKHLLQSNIINQIGELFNVKIHIAIIDLHQAGISVANLISTDSSIQQQAKQELLDYLATVSMGDYALLRTSAPFYYRSELYKTWEPAN